MPPQVNATLTKVSESSATTGDRDDWDNPGTDTEAGAGATKWEGTIDAYYREKVDRVPNGAGGVDVFVRRTLWIDTADAETLAIDTNDLLTFVARGSERTGQARTVARAATPGVSRRIQTTRLDLDDA